MQSGDNNTFLLNVGYLLKRDCRLRKKARIKEVKVI